MIKDLSRKFLITNMLTISFMMVLSFTIIFIINYSNVRKQNIEKLNSMTLVPPALINDVRNFKEINDRENPTFIQMIPTDFEISFNLIVDKDGTLISSMSFLDMKESDYEKAINLAMKDFNNYKTIKFNNKTWMYSIKETNGHIITRGGQPYKISETNVYQLSFLDITNSVTSLNKLAIILVSVGFVLLVAIYFISLYFTNNAIQPIQKVWKKQRQFIADASHEFKTPIAIINANYDCLLLNEEDSFKKQKKWINNIKSETNRMNKLVTDLLYLARIDDSNMEIEYKDFNISDIVQSCVLANEVIVHEKGLKMSSNIEEDLFIFGDIEKIKQVIMILIDNATKYNNEVGHINIYLKKENKKAILKIENTSIGIAENELPKIFDRFYRVNEARTSDESYGLGLSIAKEIITKMNGKIKVESNMNELTTFIVELNLKNK
jgi:Signal transduction histidine kinase